MSQVNSREPLNTAATESEPFAIDVKRITYQTFRYWYLILLSLLTGLAIAFLVNRYSTKVFSVTSSIIIKESEEFSGGELIYNNPLVKFYRNYLNEIYIIKSNPLIESTVVELHFDETYYRIGNFITTEAYRTLPFKTEILDNRNSKRLYFEFNVLTDNELEIKYLMDQKEQKVKAQFGEPLVIDSITFRLVKSAPVTASEHKNERYAFFYRPASEVARAYASRLVADWAEEGSGVINLSLNGSNPKKEIDFINGLIKNYQEYDLEKKNKAATNTIDFINEQLENILDSLNNAQRQMEAFKNKNVVTDLNSEAVRLVQKLEGFEIQKTDLVLRANYFNYLVEYVGKSESLDQVILPSAIGITDPIVNGLVSEMINIQSDLKMLARKEKTNPLTAEGEKRISVLRADLLESVNNQKSIDKIKLDFISSSIREIEAQLNYLPVAERQLVNIKRNYTLLENLYVFLLQRRAEAGISRAANTTDIVVVNPPSSTGPPISPSILRNYFLGFAIGLIFPFLIIIGLELLNTRIQSREDIERITAIPFIGGVGHKRGVTNIEVLSRPKSAISESFRALRSNLSYFLGSKEQGVFLVTSSISGEGKTFSSINTASVFALSGKKTLIVGADLRKPRLFSDFKLNNDKGLSNYLAGLCEFEDTLQKTDFPNLFLVSGGQIPPNPSELILSSKMNEFMRIAKEKFDYIFIDSPPLALVTDAFVLSAHVDHTLFIVRQNFTPKDLLRTIDDYYRSGKVKNLSIVLNDIYRSGPGYGYGYNYGYGYGYGYGEGKSGGGYYEE